MGRMHGAAARMIQHTKFNTQAVCMIVWDPARAELMVLILVILIFLKILALFDS